MLIFIFFSHDPQLRSLRCLLSFQFSLFLSFSLLSFPPIFNKKNIQTDLAKRDTAGNAHSRDIGSVHSDGSSALRLFSA